MHERMMDRTHQPTDTEMMEWIGHPLSAGWDHLRRFLAHTYAVEPIMNAGGKRYGWNVQYRIGGRPLCEMYPEHGSFTALVILGRAELEKAMQGTESYGENVQRALRLPRRMLDVHSRIGSGALSARGAGYRPADLVEEKAGRQTACVILRGRLG